MNPRTRECKEKSFVFFKGMGLTQNTALTLFGSKHAGEFIYKKSIYSPETLIPLLFFCGCTFHIIRRNRMVMLHSKLFPEDYPKKLPATNSELQIPETVDLEEPNDDIPEEEPESLCITITAESIGWIIKAFGGISALFNFMSAFLNGATLFEFIYGLFDDKKPGEAGPDISGFLVAIGAIAIFLSFNISKTWEHANNVRDLIRGKIKINWDENATKWTATIMTTTALISPFFAYFSSRHAFKKLPGIKNIMSDEVNKAISAFSAGTYVVSRVVSMTPSVYKVIRRFYDEGDSEELVYNKWDKWFTYGAGVGDCFGNGVGTFVAYCFLIKEMAGLETPDNEHFHVMDFLHHFGKLALAGGVVAGLLSAATNMAFSVIEGFSDAVKMEMRYNPSNASLQSDLQYDSPVLNSASKPKEISFDFNDQKSTVIKYQPSLFAKNAAATLLKKHNIRRSQSDSVAFYSFP